MPKRLNGIHLKVGVLRLQSLNGVLLAALGVALLVGVVHLVHRGLDRGATHQILVLPVRLQVHWSMHGVNRTNRILVYKLLVDGSRLRNSGVAVLLVGRLVAVGHMGSQSRRYQPMVASPFVIRG